MKTKKIKIYLISIIIVSIFVIATIFSFNIYINKYFSEMTLKNTVNSYIKGNYNKAVIFDKIYINYSGNIVLRNLKISNTDDFNDESIFIESDNMIILLNFKDLLKKRISIERITFEDVNVNLLKHYDLAYNDSFKYITSLVSKYNSIHDIVKTNVSFKNLNIKYEEYTENGKISFLVKESVLNIEKMDSELLFNLSGILPANKTPKLKNGQISINGGSIRDSSFFGKVNFEFNCSSVDLSYINYFSDDLFGSNALFSGSINIEGESTYSNNIIDISLYNKILSLGLTFENDDYMTISNLFFQNSFNILYDFNENSLKINNGILNYENYKFYYNFFFKNDYIFASVNFNDLDLHKLSNCFMPANFSNYTGLLSFNTEVKYNIKKNSFLDLKGNFNLTDFNLNNVEDGELIQLFKNTNIKTRFNKNIIKIDTQGIYYNSDFDVSFISHIKNIHPFISNSNFNLTSNTFEIDKLYKLRSRIVNTIKEYAEIDKTKSYKEIFFIQRPAGIVLNSNDLTADISISELKYKNVKFDNFIIKFILDNGKLNLQDFNLDGYNADYNLELSANLHSEWAKFNYKFDIISIDAITFMNDLNNKGFKSGNIHISENYEAVFFKLSHLLQNGVYRKTFTFNNSEIEKTLIQKNFSSFLENPSLIENMKISKLIYDYKMRSEISYLNNFQLQSDLVSFNIRTSTDIDSKPFYLYNSSERSKKLLIFNYNSFNFYNKENDKQFSIFDSFNLR